MRSAVSVSGSGAGLGRSGFGQTSPTGVQSRTLPLQRDGFSRRFASYGQL